MDYVKNSMFRKPINLLSQSFNHLNALIGFVFITFFLDAIYETFSQTSLSFILLVPLLLSKAYINAGLMSSLVEFISGEEFYFEATRFHRHAKKFFLYSAACLTLPILISFILQHVHIQFTNTVILPLSDLATAYILARIIINEKYLQPLQIKSRSTKTTDLEIVFLFLIFLFNFFLFILPDITGLKLNFLPNLLGLISRYIQFLTFTYIAQIIISNYPQITNQFSSEKELFIINPYPNGGDLLTGFSYAAWRIHPPFMVIIKALTPKNYRIRTFNQKHWRKEFVKKNILVAISCFTSNSAEAYRIAKLFKSAGSTVVMGGPHVMSMPNEALEFCDCVVVGSIEGNWREIIIDYENNCLKKKYADAPKTEDYEAVYEELYNSPPEIAKDFLETTRGCKFKCHFCGVPNTTGGRVRSQSPKDFVNILRKLKPHYNYFTFIDANIYADPTYAKEVFRALKPLKINWSSCTTIDMAKNVETLQLAQESGCKEMLIGFEIPSEGKNVVRDVKFAMAKKYLEYAEKFKKLGIHIRGTFMFGWDNDSLKSLLFLWKFCMQLNLGTTTMSLVTPLPGSMLFNEMLSQQRILNLNWQKYSYFGLVTKHPRLDNYFFPRLFLLIRYFFFFTTCSLGRRVFIGLVIFASVIISFKF